MNAFSVDGNIAFDNPSAPALRSFMRDIIGNTISEVVDPKTPAGVLLTQEEIAILQGEPNTAKQVLQPGQHNFSLPLVTNPNDPNLKAFPYPAPAGPKAEAKKWAKGKYNLNPLVWFVHSNLGAFSYAFSVDDQYGNVQVDDSTGFQVAIGGGEGIPNKTPWQNGE
jgi:hypothetical protein